MTLACDEVFWWYSSVWSVRLYQGSSMQTWKIMSVSLKKSQATVSLPVLREPKLIYLTWAHEDASHAHSSPQTIKNTSTRQLFTKHTHTHTFPKSRCAAHTRKHRKDQRCVCVWIWTQCMKNPVLRESRVTVCGVYRGIRACAHNMGDSCCADTKLRSCHTSPAQKHSRCLSRPWLMLRHVTDGRPCPVSKRLVSVMIVLVPLWSSSKGLGSRGTCRVCSGDNHTLSCSLTDPSFNIHQMKENWHYRQTKDSR